MAHIHISKLPNERWMVVLLLYNHLSFNPVVSSTVLLLSAYFLNSMWNQPWDDFLVQIRARIKILRIPVTGSPDNELLCPPGWIHLILRISVSVNPNCLMSVEVPALYLSPALSLSCSFALQTYFCWTHIFVFRISSLSGTNLSSVERLIFRQ